MKRFSSFLPSIALILAACSALRTASPVAKTASAPPPSVTLLPTSTATPTLTVTPTFTPTPTPPLPVLFQTAYPSPAARISAENLAQLTMVASWGQGIRKQVVWSPDGRYLAVLAEEGIYVHDTSTWTAAIFLPINSINCLAFSPDSSVLAAGSPEGDVFLWQLPERSPWQKIENLPDEVSSIDFSPDGKVFAIGIANGQIQVWSLPDMTLQKTKQAVEALTMNVRFLPDGQRLLFAGYDYQQVWLWNLSDDSTQPIAPANLHGITDMAISPDGTLLAIGGSFSGNVQVWDIRENRRLFKLPDTKLAKQVTISPDNTLLAVGQGDAIEIWDIVQQRRLHTLTEHKSTITDVAFAPDGQRLASASQDTTVRIWDVASGTLLKTFPDQEWASLVRCIEFRCFPTSYALSPNGEFVAREVDKRVQVWRVRDGSFIRTFEDDKFSITALAFSQDGRRLAAAGGWAIRIWDVTSGEPIAVLRGVHRDYISDITFSPDGEKLVSVSADGLACLWQVSDGRLLFKMEKPKAGSLLSVAFSPDGQFVAGGTRDGSVYLWQASNGVLLYVIRENKGWAKQLFFSPDGKTLAVSFSSAFQLWQVGPGGVKLLYTLPEVEGVAFSPDGQMIASWTRVREGQFNKPKIEFRRASDGSLLHEVLSPFYPLGFTADGTLFVSWRSSYVHWVTTPTLQLWAVQP